MAVRKRIKLCVLSIFIVSVSLSWAQEDFKVLIEPRGPTISQKAGEPFVVSCIGEASDDELFDEFRWTGPRGEIPSSSGGDVEVQSNPPNKLYVIFNKPTTEDTGKYTCSASYARTQVKESSVNITFYHGISFEECQTRQAIIVDKPAKIRCRVNANPPAGITWYKNRVDIDTDRYSVDSDGISVAKVAEEDGGTYSVKAMVPSTGQLKTVDITVEVHVPPKITQFDESYQFVEGDRVELHCQATGNPAPKYYWTNQQQQNLSNVEGYLVNSDTGVLTIQKIERDDAGDFKCQAVNSADSDYSEARVSVIVKPEVKDFQNETVVYLRDVVMRCRVSGDPKPTVSIRKDGEDRAFDYSVDRFTLETKAEGPDQVLSLTIQSAMRSDDGLYYCAGQNEGGRVERVGHLQVEFPPDMSLTTAHSKKTWKEHPVNLTCIAEAIPNATITWTFRGLPIVSNELYHVYGEASYSNLLVKPSTTVSGGTDVYGKYRCEARNQYGNNSVEIELTEARTPGRIQQNNVERNTATTITFLLRGPQDDGGLNIREFVVEYREKDDERTAVKTKEWFEGGSYILEDLKPRTAYVFRFAAKNDAGIGQFSEDTEFVMPSESTPEIPSFMMPSGTNISRFPDSYQVRWSVPQDNGKEIQFFELRLLEVEFEGNEYRQVGSDKQYKIDKWENAPRFNITNLKASAMYKVELRAKNEIGYSQPASMLFKTSAGSNVEEQKLDDNSATLTTAAMVAIIIVVVLVILGLIDATCYLRNQCGVFYCLRTAVCGRSPSSEKVKDGTIDDGKRIQTNQPKGRKNMENQGVTTEATPMIAGSVGSKDSKNNDHVNEDAKNKSPKGSKSSVAKDSLV